MPRRRPGPEEVVAERRWVEVIAAPGALTTDRPSTTGVQSRDALASRVVGCGVVVPVGALLPVASPKAPPVRSGAPRSCS